MFKLDKHERQGLIFLNDQTLLEVRNVFWAKILVVRFFSWCFRFESLLAQDYICVTSQAALLCSLTTLSLLQPASPAPLAYVTQTFN